MSWMRHRSTSSVYIHTYIHIHRCIHTYIHTYIHTVYIHTYCTYIHTYIIRANMYVCMLVCMFVCKYVCIFKALNLQSLRRICPIQKQYSTNKDMRGHDLGKTPQIRLHISVWQFVRFPPLHVFPLFLYFLFY